jgi:processive 1,2-diacylglycerol beta-glucosyltransferase
MNQKILILYAKSGFLGHKVIADNYASLLKKLGCEVQISDVFEIDHNNQIEIGNRAYFLLLQKISWLWRFLYFYWAHIPGLNWARTSLFPRRLKKTQQLIINQHADIIITTHPVATAVVNYLKSRGRITADLFTTFSDWHTQSFWIFPHVNKFLVATLQHKADLINLGFNADQVEVTGMLLAENFYNAPSKQEARHCLNLPQDVKVILVMGGGKGWGIEELIKSLDHLHTDAHIIVIGGSNERKVQIEKCIWRHTSQPSKFVVTGFIDPAPYFSAADLLISKPGGLTTSQAFLLRLPMLPVLPLPGQEDENVRILNNNNSVLVADKGVDLASNVDRFLSNQKKLEEVTSSAFQLISAQTPQAVSQIIMSIKQP